jgi:hypothetical protein
MIGAVRDDERDPVAESSRSVHGAAGRRCGFRSGDGRRGSGAGRRRSARSRRVSAGGRWGSAASRRAERGERLFAAGAGLRLKRAAL